MRFLYPILVLLLLILSGCGQSSFLQKRESIQEAIQNRESSPAERQIIRNMQPGNQSALFQTLNSGMLAFSAGQPDTALQYWNRAERIIDDQYTRRISQKLTSMVSNEYSENYEGYPIEHLLLHFFKSLSLLQKNDPEAAVVEMRKMNERFTYLEDHPEPYKRKRSHFRLLNLYAGHLFAMAGEENDARVSFLHAGLDYDSLVTAGSAPGKQPLTIRLDGFIQELFEGSIHLLITTESDFHSIKVAYPVLFDRFAPQPVHPVYPGEKKSEEVSLPVNARFEEDFNARESIMAKERIGRAATKFLLSSGVTTVTGAILDDREAEREKQRQENKEVDEPDGFDTFLQVLWIGGQVMKVVGTATEMADLRQWFTLPASISLSQSSFPESVYPDELFRTDRILVRWTPARVIRSFPSNQYQKSESIDFTGKALQVDEDD